MTFNIYHNGFLLLKTKGATMAWEKAKQYSVWFSSIEVRREKY